MRQVGPVNSLKVRAAMTGPDTALQELARRRWRVAITLTVAMIALYFGFILLVAFDKPLLGRLISPGLSLGVLLGALVIVLSWIMTFVYVRWANLHYDKALDELRSGQRP